MRIADVGAELTLAESTGRLVPAFRDRCHELLVHSHTVTHVGAKHQTPTVHNLLPRADDDWLEDADWPPDLGEATSARQYKLAIGCQAPGRRLVPSSSQVPPGAPTRKWSGGVYALCGCADGVLRVHVYTWGIASEKGENKMLQSGGSVRANGE